jgi:bifunctional non-homologous end joining protein LigD
MAKAQKKSAALRTVCLGAKESAMPGVIQPMLATLVDAPFSDPHWLFETKWDGIRAVCFLDKGKPRFVSRNQNDLTAQYPELANIADSIHGSRVILDGEIVALDEQGVSKFQLLQPRMGRKNQAEIARLTAKTRLVYYVFDLLYLDGLDLTACTLLDRKGKLESILKSAQNVRYSDHIIEHGKELYQEIARVPLEGMIAKRLDSVYAQKRSRDWLKIKTVLEAEVVIGGYTEPRNSRSYFGALVVGLYDQGKLHYVGHAGGGFNEKSLAQIYNLLQPLKINSSPFAEKVQTNEPVQWVKPKLVAQVRFAEWTADRRLRQPIFLGLREDKNPEECTFEVKRETEKVVKQSKRSGRRTSV